MRTKFGVVVLFAAALVSFVSCERALVETTEQDRIGQIEALKLLVKSQAQAIEGLKLRAKNQAQTIERLASEGKGTVKNQAQTVERLASEGKVTGRQLLGGAFVNILLCGKYTCSAAERLRYTAYTQVLSLTDEAKTNSYEKITYQGNGKLGTGSKSSAAQTYSWQNGKCRAQKTARCSLSKSGANDKVTCSYDLKSLHSTGGTKALCAKGVKVLD